jgi:transposase
MSPKATALGAGRATPPTPRCSGSRGETKAIFAVADTMLVITWHVLAAQQPYKELGVDYFTRRSEPQAHARRLAREMEKQGFQVTIEPRAA